MPTETRKAELLKQYKACSERTRIMLTAGYLKKVRQGSREQLWWNYLEQQLRKLK